MSRMRFAYADYSFVMTSFSINELGPMKSVDSPVFTAAGRGRNVACHAW